MWTLGPLLVPWVITGPLQSLLVVPVVHYGMSEKANYMGVTVPIHVNMRFI